MSGENGAFRIAPVPPGTYRLVVERKGYRPHTFLRPASELAEPIIVAEGLPAKHLEIRIVPLSSVSGTVTDREGRPVAQAVVHVLKRLSLQGRSLISSVASARTGAGGDYLIENVPDGAYLVGAVPPSVRPLDGEKMSVNQEANVPTYYPGVLDLGMAQPVQVVPGQNRFSTDLRLERSRVYVVAGSVAGPEGGAGDLMISLEANRAESAPAFLVRFANPKLGTRFEFRDVPPGRYFLLARSKRNLGAHWAKAVIQVENRDIKDVELRPVPPFVAVGRIRVPEDMAGAVTMGRLRVELVAADGSRFGLQVGRVNDDGSFQIENVPADRYFAMVRGLPQGGWLRSVRLEHQETRDTGFGLSGPGMPPIDILVATGQAKIEGSARNAKREPSDGCMVSLTPEPMAPHLAELRRVTPTDKSGRFSLRNVAPGNYRMHCWRGLLGVVSYDPAFLSKHEGVSVKISGEDALQVSLTETVIEGIQR
ncbi:MAG TPA: hypothetical protein DEH78_06085 [Solibacterales bacterium]|nr:hypothetical protein [Bryobacterales bacterium]